MGLVAEMYIATAEAGNTATENDCRPPVPQSVPPSVSRWYHGYYYRILTDVCGRWLAVMYANMSWHTLAANTNHVGLDWHTM